MDSFTILRIRRLKQCRRTHYSVTTGDLKSTLRALTRLSGGRNVVVKGICDLFVAYLRMLWHSYSIISVTASIFIMELIILVAVNCLTR